MAEALKNPTMKAFYQTCVSYPAAASAPDRRGGKVLVAFALVLPTLFAVLALFIDGSMLLLRSRVMQNAADAAATEGALRIAAEAGDPVVAAENVVSEWHGLSMADIETWSPPQTGVYAGRDGFVEVCVREDYEGFFPLPAAMSGNTYATGRGVAGLVEATGPAAVVVLDPDPPEIHVGRLPLAVPSVNPLLGGLEVVGLGSLDVFGAIHVNNTWGGLDENGNAVGDQQLLTAACSCTPVLALTRVRATDLRVVGGVDSPDNYDSIDPAASRMLSANRKPVPDPLIQLPVPTVTADPENVRTVEFGGITANGLTPLGGDLTLQPGVYEWIEVTGGRVTFLPGIYIIRSVSPVHGIALNLSTCEVQANGVMFYLTNSPAYSPTSGVPDSLDQQTAPPSPGAVTQLPSAFIANVLTTSQFLPLDDVGSPFHGMLIYQRRCDRRPVIVSQQTVLGAMDLRGMIYSKWGNLAVVGNETFQAAFVVGSLRMVVTTRASIDPVDMLPPAFDVALVE